MLKEILIEKWFPVNEASIESGRERAGPNMMPPLYFLHLWWSRKPLAASRMAAVLAALPADAYEKPDFSRLLSAMGLRGDPVKAIKAGEKSFPYKIFEGQSPNPSLYMPKAIGHWGRKPVGADLMAGGGSIPFEMARSGYGEVVSGEYNPVAYVILKAAVEYPARYGDRLVPDVEQYGKIVLRDLREKVKEYYPPHPSGQPSGYIWVRYFSCPECGCEVPSLISLQLDRVKGYAFYPEVKGDRTELRVVKIEELEKIKVGRRNEVRVRITEGPLKGTIFDTIGYENDGVLECPAHRHTISEEKVKRQYREYLEEKGQKGYYGSHSAKLVAVVHKEGGYAEPTPEMIKAYVNAEESLKDKWPELLVDDLIPTENHEKGEADRVVEYGLDTYDKFFNARQLIVHAELVRLIREVPKRVVENELRKGSPSQEAEEYGKAIATYLALALGKTLDYNSLITSWDRSQGSINHTFDQHAFGWTWEYGEIGVMTDDASPSWAIKNSLKSLKGLIKRTNASTKTKTVVGDASKLNAFNNYFDVIITDPPYYGSIQYSELSDYFYVWWKRAIGNLYPEAFTTIDTPKTDEAVANRVRHGGAKLSNTAYEHKMAEIFENHHRMLRDEGILVLWFAHKTGAAWSSTIHALLNAGFTITSLWGVRTEMEHSLHISGKAALRTNILMTCRKQQATPGYLQDVLHQLETRVEQRLQELEEYGLVGSDFIMAAQAEALKAASQRWPLRDPEGKLSPMEMLDHAMDYSVGQAANYITSKVAPQITGVDAPTKFYVLVKYLYGESIPYDDARRIALACVGTTSVGDPVTEIAVNTGLAALKKAQLDGSTATLLNFHKPWDRAREGRIPGQPTIIDSIHNAITVLEEGGTTNKAAEALAPAGGAACEVLKALYQVLPDQLKEGRTVSKNVEKEHVQTLLLTVCQEGLHLQAARRLAEEQPQRRITEYSEIKPDPRKYDPILDAFQSGSSSYVKVEVSDTDPQTLLTMLSKQIADRNQESNMKVTLIGKTVYLEKR